jgi:hypothetical protein
MLFTIKIHGFHGYIIKIGLFLNRPEKAILFKKLYYWLYTFRLGFKKTILG